MYARSAASCRRRARSGRRSASARHRLTSRGGDRLCSTMQTAAVAAASTGPPSKAHPDLPRAMVAGGIGAAMPGGAALGAYAIDVGSSVDRRPGAEVAGKIAARSMRFGPTPARDCAHAPEWPVRPLRRLLCPRNPRPRARAARSGVPRRAGRPGLCRRTHDLLANYAGRPTPLTRCRNLPGNIYLKREDLLHGGAHKTNQVLGQGLLAKRMGKTRLIAETGAGQHGVLPHYFYFLISLLYFFKKFGVFIY